MNGSSEVDGPMSYDIVKRVGALEGDVRNLTTEVTVLSRDMNEVKAGNSAILQKLDAFSLKQAQQPRPTNWTAVLITIFSIASGIGTFAVGTWWFIGTSPIIQDLDKRLTKLDDPDVGKVRRMESEIQWWPRVSKVER